MSTVEAPAPGPAAVAPAGPAGDWPHTTRVLPWLLAVFLGMFWLVPFDSIDLAITLPFDAKLDRVLMAVTILLWLGAFLSGRAGGPRIRHSLLNRTAVVFLAVAAASYLLNLRTIEWLGAGSTGLKSLALLMSYMVFFLVVSSVVRQSELKSFVKLFLVLACIAALGTIWEYRFDYNIFYEWSAALLPDVFQVSPSSANPEFERANVVGPTGHGLAIASMLAMAFPFAIAYWFQASTTREKVFYFFVTAILLAGALATIRKSAAIVPAAALLALLVLRPRDMIRLAPAGVAILVMIQILAPGAGAQIKSQLTSFFENRQSASTQGRTSDYEAIRPDRLAHPVLGRGFGTYSPDEYRILDNQYLGLSITTGLVGVAAYLALVLSVIFTSVSTIRSRDPIRGPPALAAAAGAAGFGMASALFDVLAFPQAPYIFFFLAGLAVVASGRLPRAAAAAAERERAGPPAHGLNPGASLGVPSLSPRSP